MPNDKRTFNILFTGCATGFGKYVADRLAEQGHFIYGVGYNGPDYRLDFDYESAERFELHTAAVVDAMLGELETRRREPMIDVLINNAGWTHMEFTPKHSLKDFERVIRVNTLAPFAFCRQIVQHWNGLLDAGITPKHPRGHFVIVNTGSGSIDQALRSSPGYVASKAGIHAITRTLAKEFAGIKPYAIATVSPATVENTKMIDEIIARLMQTRGMTREQAIAYNANVPMKKWCSHEDCWSAFNWVINDMPTYYSGTNVRMPGGNGL